MAGIEKKDQVNHSNKNKIKCLYFGGMVGSYYRRVSITIEFKEATEMRQRQSLNYFILFYYLPLSGLPM